MKAIFINLEKVEDLQVGDRIRHKSAYPTYIVTGNYGNRVTAVRTVDVTNPIEWEILKVDFQGEIPTLQQLESES